MQMTLFEIMQALKVVGAWRLCSAFIPKFETLILYYKLYEMMLKKEPNRTYGYLVRLLKDDDVRAILPKDRFGVIKWEPNTLRMAIREMDRVYWV